MTISARVTLAKELQAAGDYNWKPLVTSAIGFVSGLAVLATLTPDMLPEFMHPFYPYLVGIGRIAVLIGMIAGGVLAQTSQKVLPKPESSDDQAPQ